ncbi:MAG: hypothetical protein Q9169_007174 [Polycauliona sp. 2 TL-2023]
MRQSLTLSWRFFTSRLHKPLPLNRRESQQLLARLNDSFNRNLDNQYPQGLGHSDHSPDHHIQSLLKSPLFGDKRPQHPSSSTRGSGTTQNAPLVRDFMFAVEQPVQYFKQQIADGKANIDTAKLALDNQMKKTLASPSLDPKESLKTSEIGSLVANWLWSSGQYERMDFIKDRVFTTRLMPFLVAEGQYKPVWQWLQRSCTVLCQPTAKETRLVFHKDVGVMLRALLQSEVTYGQGLESAIHLFLTSFKSLKLASHGSIAIAQRIHAAAGAYISWEYASHGASVNLGDHVIKELEQSVSEWASSHMLGPYQALIDLSHPRTPDASRALKWISIIEASDGHLAKWNRQANVRIGLKTVEVLLMQGSVKEAGRVMKVLQTMFASEVGLDKRSAGAHESEEESTLRSLNMLGILSTSRMPPEDRYKSPDKFQLPKITLVIHKGIEVLRSSLDVEAFLANLTVYRKTKEGILTSFPRRKRAEDIFRSTKFSRVVEREKRERRPGGLGGNPTSEKNIQAWHCTAHDAKGPYRAPPGKWYLQVSRRYHKSESDAIATGHLPPDTRVWYRATIEDGRPIRLRPAESDLFGPRRGRCTGELYGQEGDVVKNGKPLLIQRAVRRPSNTRPSGSGNFDDTDTTDTLADEETGDTETSNFSADQGTSGGTDTSDLSFDEGNSNDFSTFDDEEASGDTDSSFSADQPSSNQETSSDEDLASEANLPDDQELPSQDVDSPEFKYLHSCKGGDQAVAVPMQNESSWNEVGCLPGFLCVNNSPELLPTYCPPLVACQSARMTGGSCGPQGEFEPVVCPSGSYCPLGGKEKIECPAGHWCSVGFTKPKKCSPGASCPAGSTRNMTFLPPGLILAVDTMVVLIMLFVGARRYFSNKHGTSSNGKRFSRLNKSTSFFDKNAQSKKYRSLGDDDIALESRITHVERSDTAFGGNFTPLDAQEDDNELISDLDLFIQSMSKCIGTEKFGLSFEFTDLKFQPKKAKKPILSEVTGKIDRGSLWGVMGASGAGKSTFVNVLMGKLACTGGTTKINGVPGDIKKYKKIIGYVPQDDIVLPELTVRENILHSARIRLPSNWGDEQIQKHVDILISCLQLAHVKDSLVGSAANPVISGGQRKRVSIGIELAAAPMALFLDEPTSGLDATSASSIMMTLKELSRLNITVITIIHQPRTEIFESLDSILLFGKGRVIYQGPEREIQPYFQGLGFNFPSSGNPADTIMDIIAGQGHLYKTSGDTGIWSLIHNWKQCRESRRLHRASNASDISTLPALPNSAGFPLTPTLHSTPNSNKTAEALSFRRSIKSRGAPFYRQTYYCLLRSLLQQYRFRSSFFFEIFLSALGGFLIGLAQFKAEGVNYRGFYLPPYAILSSSIDYSSVPLMAVLVGIAIGLIGSSPGVKIFGEEKLIYSREASSGHNRLAYYLGKVISTFPRMFVACLHFTALFMLLATPRITWGSAFLANLLYFYTIYGLASIVSMLTRREDGPLLAVMASLIVGILNGMSPNLSQVADWHMLWFWRILPGTWLAEAYFDKNVGVLGSLYAIEHASDSTGYRLGKFGWDCCVLLIIGTVYRILAFLAMRFLNQRGKG